MRKTEVFGIDIPELGDPSDITVVSDAIHDVENAMGCRIEFMNAVSTPGLISLNSKVRIHPYTTYYDDMVFAFIAPVDIPVGNSIAIKIDDLPQQPFNNEAFNSKGSLVFITYNTKTGFKSYENGSRIINDLTTGGVNNALSAEMGKQLQNNKLDKGAVSAEYDTAKKIEDKIKTKLNQGNVPVKYNTAEKIGKEIDGKVSKSGDTITGTLTLTNNAAPLRLSYDSSELQGWFARSIEFKIDNQTVGELGILGSKGVTDNFFIGKDYNTQQLKLFNDGRTELYAKNLQTPQKEVIEATNSLYDILQNNSGLNFDENLLFLNDAGAKTQGKIYFDRLTQGMFECIQTTTSTVNDIQYFKNISNKENSDRLSNLIKPLSVSKIGNNPLTIESSIKIGKVGIITLTSPGISYSYKSEEVLLEIKEKVKCCNGALSDAAGNVLTVVNRGNNLVAYSVITQRGSTVGTLIVILV